MTSSTRRRFIAATGLAFTLGGLQQALAAGRIPLMQGINTLKGSVTLNGRPATVGQVVALGDTVTVGAGGEAVYVVGENAFLQVGPAVVRVDGSSTTKLALRVLTGALASVFAKGEHQVRSGTATVGIRGTAMFIEAAAERTYFCLCYGAANLSTSGARSVNTEMVTRHHDRPYFIGNDGALAPAPVMHHSDAELIMLEALVGRKPVFMDGSDSAYSSTVPSTSSSR